MGPLVRQVRRLKQHGYAGATGDLLRRGCTRKPEAQVPGRFPFRIYFALVCKVRMQTTLPACAECGGL
jgi:hypothetical protein